MTRQTALWIPYSPFPLAHRFRWAGFPRRENNGRHCAGGGQDRIRTGYLLLCQQLRFRKRLPPIFPVAVPGVTSARRSKHRSLPTAATRSGRSSHHRWRSHSSPPVPAALCLLTPAPLLEIFRAVFEYDRRILPVLRPDQQGVRQIVKYFPFTGQISPAGDQDHLPPGHFLHRRHCQPVFCTSCS